MMANMRYAIHKKVMAEYQPSPRAHAPTSNVIAPRAIHQNRKSRRSRLTKWPVMVLQAGSDCVSEASLTIENRGQQAERQLVATADQEHMVGVGVEPFRQIGGEHNRRAAGSLALLEQAEKRASAEDVERGGDLVRDDQLRPRGQRSDNLNPSGLSRRHRADPGIVWHTEPAHERSLLVPVVA